MTLTQNNIQPLSLRVNDACAALGVGRTALYRLISENKLRAIKIAGRTVIPVTELVRVTEPGSTIH